MIGKRKILLRIQHFQKCGRWVSAKITAYLVNFIQHKDRIVGFSPPQALNDASGERSDIGAPVAPDFGLVSNTPQGNTVELATQCTRNGLPQ